MSMLIRRAELRLAFTAGLTNAFALLSGLPFGYYAPLAVLAVCTGSYGGSLALGRQRLLGSLLGAAILLVAYGGLKDLPLPLGMAVALGALRLFGGALGLQVGYKVGGMIVVMGWLVHDDQLAAWIPLRLFWTAFGILTALLSLRLFWPARASAASLQGYATLLRDLALALEAAADPQPHRRERRRQLRTQLVSQRRLEVQVTNELGSRPEHHPLHQLLQVLDDCCSRLIVSSDSLGRQGAWTDLPPALGDLHQAQADLLGALAQRLRLWAEQLETPGEPLPPPPSQPMAIPDRWMTLERRLADPDLCSASPGLSLEGLQHNASRLTLCSLALRTLETGERRWRGLAGVDSRSAAVQRGRDASQRSRR